MSFTSEKAKLLGLTEADFIQRLEMLENELESKNKVIDEQEKKIKDLEFHVEEEFELLFKEMHILKDKAKETESLDEYLDHVNPINLKGITAYRAYYSFEYLKTMPERLGAIFLNPKEHMDYLQNLIPDPFKIPKNGNPRATRLRVISEMVDMFPNSVFVSRRTRKLQPKVIVLRKKNKNV